MQNIDRRQIIRVATLGGAALAVRAADKRTSASDAQTLNPMEVGNLVAFWDFQEAASQKRAARSGDAHPLVEGNGPVDRVEGGVFGRYAARIREGQWFFIPRSELGALNIRGPRAQVTVIAWIWRETAKPWQAIGGVWDESRMKRQFYLFTNAAGKRNYRDLARYPANDNVQGHISAVGGPTPGHNVCATYASGSTPMRLHQWQTVAMSYDGQWIRAYLNGALDASEGFNPFLYPDGIFDGGKDGAIFSVGANSVQGKMLNFFAGRIGGLAVYSRAVTEAEIRGLSRG